MKPFNELFPAFRIVGVCNGMTKGVEHQTWKNMIVRCYEPTANGYYRYGGRGITVCPEWRGSFQNFCLDMGPRPKGRSLDRIDGTKGYSWANCRWATAKQQQRNRHWTPRPPKVKPVVDYSKVTRSNTSGVRGVSLHHPAKCLVSYWRATWRKNGVPKAVFFPGTHEGFMQACEKRKWAETHVYRREKIFS